jgi:DNA topoisomerase IA
MKTLIIAEKPSVAADLARVLGKGPGMSKFVKEKDYFDYKLESDPRFEARISRTREQKKQGDVIRLEDIEP